MRHYICTDDLLYDTGRSDNAIKNRWHLLQRLSRRKAKQQQVSILSSIYTTTTGINNCNYMEQQQQQSLSLPAFQSNGPTEDVGPLEDEHSSISESSICLDFMTDDDIITKNQSSIFQRKQIWTLVEDHELFKLVCRYGDSGCW